MYALMQMAHMSLFTVYFKFGFGIGVSMQYFRPSLSSFCVFSGGCLVVHKLWKARNPHTKV